MIEQEHPSVQGRPPQYGEAGVLPQPHLNEDPGGHLTALLDKIDQPGKRHKLKALLSFGDMEASSGTLAIRDLKKHLMTIPIDGDDKRVQREYALRTLANKVKNLGSSSQNTAIRLLHRYLAPDLAVDATTQRGSFKIPNLVDIAQDWESARRNIIHEEARMEILRELLQVLRPLPLLSSLDILGIALNNYDNQEKIGSETNRIRLLTCLIQAADHVLVRYMPLRRGNLLGTKFNGLAERIRAATNTQIQPIMISGSLPQTSGELREHSRILLNAYVAAQLLFTDADMRQELGHIASELPLPDNSVSGILLPEADHNAHELPAYPGEGPTGGA